MNTAPGPRLDGLGRRPPTASPLWGAGWGCCYDWREMYCGSGGCIASEQKLKLRPSIAMAGKSYFNPNVPEIVVKSLFKKYDTDDSGRLGKNEMLTLLKEDLGMKENQAQACILLVDKDGCGEVSFDEFTLWLRTEKGFRNIDDSSRYYKVQKAIELFKEFDKDGNGTIDREEFKKLFKKFQANCDASQIDNALQALDTSGDGKISFPEFLAWLNWLPAN